MDGKRPGRSSYVSLCRFRIPVLGALRTLLAVDLDLDAARLGGRVEGKGTPLDLTPHAQHRQQRLGEPDHVL